MDTYLALALATVMGLVAAGVVLSVKISRRRHATGVRTLGTAVPARPLSAADAERMMRRYWWTAGVVLGLLVLGGIVVAAAP